LDVGTQELLLSAHEDTTLAAARPGAFAMSGDRLDTGLGGITIKPVSGYRIPVKRHRGEPYPVKRHRGEPGHTRDTRTHKGTRTAQTSLTTIQTHQQRATRTSDVSATTEAAYPVR
jgi:hypothetical protein